MQLGGGKYRVRASLTDNFLIVKTLAWWSETMVLGRRDRRMRQRVLCVLPTTHRALASSEPRGIIVFFEDPLTKNQPKRAERTGGCAIWGLI